MDVRAEQSADGFRQWFTANEQRFRRIEASRKDALLGEILEHLHAYSAGLFLEMGGAPDGPNELVITAAGKRDLFPAAPVGDEGL